MAHMWFAYQVRKGKIYFCNSIHLIENVPFYRSNRNYHIFYYVYYGLKQDRLASQYFLEGRNSLRFLPIGDTDAEINYYLSGYQKLKEHLVFWDMEKVEQEFIFQTIAAILLIGQINFDDENGSAFVSNPNILNDGTS